MMTTILAKILYTYSNFPAVSELLPQDVLPCVIGPGQKGLCTHPEIAESRWVISGGEKAFAFEADLPDKFYWFGLQARGGPERLFVMWLDEGRKFYFFDQYFSGFGGDQSPKRTNRRFELAFKRWQTTKGDVIYNGDYGFFDSKKGRLLQKHQKQLSEDIDDIPKISSPENLAQTLTIEKVQNNWPELSDYVPENVFSFERGTGKIGLCTHPEVTTDRWVQLTGGENFNLNTFLPDFFRSKIADRCRLNFAIQRVLPMKTVPPEGFFWGGTHKIRLGEYLFLMWFRNDRKFWFYHRLLDHTGNSFIDNAAARLKQAIMLWENSTKDVIYSEKLGWYHFI